MVNGRGTSNVERWMERGEGRVEVEDRRKRKDGHGEWMAGTVREY